MPKRTLELLRIGIDDVGEDADLGGVVDEVGIFDVEQRDDRAAAFLDDLADQPERVLGALIEADDRDVGQVIGGEQCD